MKILFASPFHAPVGGITKWANHIYNFYNNLPKTNLEITPLPMDRFANSNRSENRFIDLISGIKDYWKFIRVEKDFLRREHFDIVHISSSAGISLIKDLMMIKVAHKYGSKAIIHFHFGRIPDLKQANNWEWKLLKHVVSKADYTIVLDRTSEHTLKSDGFGSIANVPNPVAPVVNTFVESHTLNRKDRFIYFAGHCYKTKGVYELVSVCSKIKNIKVKLAGSISYSVRNDLLALSHHGKWLELAGAQSFEQVLTDMSQCDLFVLPSYTEGFPNVILEAMACGCAIVTTDVGAIPQILEDDKHGTYGAIVKPQNEEQLLESILSLLSNNKLKETCRQNVQRRVNERYNISVIWNDLQKVWTCTMKSHE